MAELNARAEVVGYPESVLETIRDLIRLIDADPEFATFTGLGVADVSKVPPFAENEAVAHFMFTMARLITVAAGVALAREPVQ